MEIRTETSVKEITHFGSFSSFPCFLRAINLYKISSWMKRLVQELGEIGNRSILLAANSALARNIAIQGSITTIRSSNYHRLQTSSVPRIVFSRETWKTTRDDYRVCSSPLPLVFSAFHSALLSHEFTYSTGADMYI